MELDMLEAEATRLILPGFSEEAALQLGLTLVGMARAERLPVAIDIRTADRTLFHVSLRGATPNNANWARRKSNTAFRFQAASLLVQKRMAAKQETLEKHGLTAADFAVEGGAVPIMVSGLGMVACVTVSGLPQVDDHKLAVRAIESLR